MNPYKLNQIPEIPIKYKHPLRKADRIQLRDAADCYHACKLLFSEETIEWREEMIIICLNAASEVIGFYRISCGGVTGTICDERIVFQVCLACNASRFLLCHNHPSGQLAPSVNDIKLTENIAKAGKLLNIHIMDHLIITEDGFTSMHNEGII